MRDQLFAHEPAAPTGVGRDLAPIAVREFTTFQAVAVQVGPPSAGRYEPDPDRLNIDLASPAYSARTGIDVELDLAVVDTGDPSADDQDIGKMMRYPLGLERHQVARSVTRHGAKSL